MLLTTELMSIIAFYAIIAALIIIYRKKIDIQHKILFLLRTKKGISLINKLSKYQNFWKIWGYVGIPVGFLGMFFAIYMLAANLVAIFKVPAAAAGVSLVIPGVHIPGISIYLPFWYGIISLAIVLFVHEFSHGVVAKANGLDIKSAGVGMLGPLPLAFVEPSEKKLQKSSLKTRLSVFAAGPFANICTAVLVSIIATFLLIPAAMSISEPAGINIVSVEEGMPAQLSGLQDSIIITGFNNNTIYAVQDFEQAMLATDPGDVIFLETSEGLVEIQTISSPDNESRAYIGVAFKQNLAIKESVSNKFGTALPWSVFYLIQLSYWLYLLNLGIGLVNLLPLGPIDGGRMVDAVLRKYIKKGVARRLFVFITAAALLILVMNIFLPVTLQVLA